jgi:integrase
MRARREFEEAGATYRDQGFVFAQPGGESLTANMITWEWKKLRKLLGTNARLHDLRHTNASLLLHAGVPMKIVQERLGHSSYQITADIYSHLVPGLAMGAKAAERLDALLRVEGSNGSE